MAIEVKQNLSLLRHKSRAAEAIISKSICCDLHGCMPVRPNDDNFLPQLERYKECGNNLVFINVGWDVLSIEDHFKVIAHFRSWLRQNSENYVCISDIGDLSAISLSGRLVVAFDIEGMNAISDQLSLIHLYYTLGVRWMSIAYNRNNRVGGGCQDEDAGLTQYGREVLNEMARVGMLVCCSHTGRRTSLEAIDLSPSPVIFSHSNAAAITEHPRNIDDEVIKACASRGGVIGVNGIDRLLGGGDLSAALVRHIDHMVQMVGPEHVALGLDYVFDPSELDEYHAKFPDSYPGHLYGGSERDALAPEALTVIVSALLDLGYSHDAISLILGRNVMRLAARVWRF